VRAHLRWNRDLLGVVKGMDDFRGNYFVIPEAVVEPRVTALLKVVSRSTSCITSSRVGALMKHAVMMLKSRWDRHDRRRDRADARNAECIIAVPESHHAKREEGREIISRLYVTARGKQSPRENLISGRGALCFNLEISAGGEMIFRPVMRFNGRYEKPTRRKSDASRRRSLRKSVNLYTPIFPSHARAHACIVDSGCIFFCRGGHVKKIAARHALGCFPAIKRLSLCKSEREK